MSGKDYPGAYQQGYKDFYYERYIVKEGVLIPRPDTELLVEAALMLCGALKGGVGDVLRLAPSVSSTEIRLADLCSGTGCVGISVANALIRSGRSCTLTLVDLSDTALECSRENLSVCNASARVIKADILKEDPLMGEFDVITSNPPYITDEEMDELPLSVMYEPELALRGGADGLVFYDRLCKIGRSHLKPGGALAVEHGWLQQEQVMEIFRNNGYTEITGLRDFGGNPRVVAGIFRGDTNAQ